MVRWGSTQSSWVPGPSVEARCENRYGYCDGLIVSKSRQLGKLEQDARSVLLIQPGLR